MLTINQSANIPNFVLGSVWVFDTSCCIYVCTGSCNSICCLNTGISRWILGRNFCSGIRIFRGRGRWNGRFRIHFMIKPNFIVSVVIFFNVTSFWNIRIVFILDLVFYLWVFCLYVCKCADTNLFLCNVLLVFWKLTCFMFIR